MKQNDKKKKKLIPPSLPSFLNERKCFHAGLVWSSKLIAHQRFSFLLPLSRVSQEVKTSCREARCKSVCVCVLWVMRGRRGGSQRCTCGGREWKQMQRRLAFSRVARHIQLVSLAEKASGSILSQSHCRGHDDLQRDYRSSNELSLEIQREREHKRLKAHTSILKSWWGEHESSSPGLHRVVILLMSLTQGKECRECFSLLPFPLAKAFTPQPVSVN